MLRINKVLLIVESFQDDLVRCNISDHKGYNELLYDSGQRKISFKTENHLSYLLHENQLQFDKILQSAVKGTLNNGQTIHCVIIPGFRFLKESDFLKYIRVDRRNSKVKISGHKKPLRNIHKIYTDGSFSSKTNRSGYAGFIKYPDGKTEIFQNTFDGGSNNMMELMAVTEGLQRLNNIVKVQINTDSRFVIRGLAQWVHFWKHNNWETAYGRKVKLAQQWQKTEALCNDKLLEFKWIKGHSGIIEQDFCHDLARISVSQKNY